MVITWYTSIESPDELALSSRRYDEAQLEIKTNEPLAFFGDTEGRHALTPALSPGRGRGIERRKRSPHLIEGYIKAFSLSRRNDSVEVSISERIQHSAVAFPLEHFTAAPLTKR
jgi:hypothetical protein